MGDMMDNDPITLPAGLAHLTPQQIRVCACIVRGMSNRQIAAALGISVHTAKFHLDQTIKRLGAANRTHAAAVIARMSEIPIGRVEPTPASLAAKPMTPPPTALSLSLHIPGVDIEITIADFDLAVVAAHAPDEALTGISAKLCEVIDIASRELHKRWNKTAPADNAPPETFS